MNISTLIVSVDEWRSQLDEYLIDYDSLDIKDTIAQGLWICKSCYSTATSACLVTQDKLHVTQCHAMCSAE